MKDLGYANGWAETPEIIKNCRQHNNHKIHSKKIGRCIHQTTCETCDYTYKVDSSD
jgi:hypothetical protein